MYDHDGIPWWGYIIILALLVGVCWMIGDCTYNSCIEDGGTQRECEMYVWLLFS